MRRIDLQIVRGRLRAQASAPASPTEVPCGGISSNGDPRTGHRTSVRLTHSSPAQRRCHLHPNPFSHRGGEQGSPPTGGSTTPLRQGSRRAARWDGPGPALPRGPSRDGLKTNTVDLRGWRIPAKGRHTRLRLAPASHGRPNTHSHNRKCWPAGQSRPGYPAIGGTGGRPTGRRRHEGGPTGRSNSVDSGG